MAFNTPLALYLLTLVCHPAAFHSRMAVETAVHLNVTFSWWSLCERLFLVPLFLNICLLSVVIHTYLWCPQCSAPLIHKVSINSTDTFSVHTLLYEPVTAYLKMWLAFHSLSDQVMCRAALSSIPMWSSHYPKVYCGLQEKEPVPETTAVSSSAWILWEMRTFHGWGNEECRRAVNS